MLGQREDDGVVDFPSLERQRLMAVTAALFTHGADTPELLHLWLHLETVTVVVRVAADWTFHITPDEPGESYAMQELDSRVDMVPASAEVFFVRHVGDRLVHVVEKFDTEVPAQCVGAEFIFETGSVVAQSFEGDLHLAGR
ncbi:hypothetical protein [Streptosporangium longisporum]|uniref:hypothetical protein n=1 Tax=Streptosporangium longisporum TaxID=46187 RepID=UPI0031E9AA22